MDKSQKICCTVESCKYNNNDGLCSLNEITVTPIKDCNTKHADESMCSSYKYEKNIG
ncbi:MAG: DUF1540 domain-containing protein [Clostridia bacterium]|nr:DUF1540 domain-containing protein [Clostridia bacterium]